VPDIIQRSEPAVMQPEAGASELKASRWTRTHTIWLLSLLSLIPGVIIALYRGHWEELPAGVKGAVYLTCTMLIVAVCGLIMTGGGKQDR
jgi:hypothetical protein